MTGAYELPLNVYFQMLSSLVSSADLQQCATAQVGMLTTRLHKPSSECLMKAA